MGSNRSRKAKARERLSYQIEEIFERIAAEREERTIRVHKPELSIQRLESEKKSERENPNHPCYKCIGCIHWTKCPGYYQLLDCIEKRKRAYERKQAGNE